MLLKSVKLFMSQKNPALTQPMISLFLLVFKSVFSTAPPFSIIMKSYRHIYFNPRDHPEDVSICYQLFKIINCLQPAYQKDLLQSLVRRLSSASVDDRNGAKKCLISIDNQYSPFLLHTLCLEMIPPPPHGIDTLLELTCELLKSYKSVNEQTNHLDNASNMSYDSSKEGGSTLSPIDQKINDQSTNNQNQKSNSSLESNKVSNSKTNTNPNSVAYPNHKSNQSSLSNSGANIIQKPNINSNKISNSKNNANSNSHGNLPTPSISIPNPHPKPIPIVGKNSNIAPRPTPKQPTLKINADSKVNLIKNPKSNEAIKAKPDLKSNADDSAKLNESAKANTNSKTNTSQTVEMNDDQKVNSKHNEAAKANSNSKGNDPPKNNFSSKHNSNEIIRPNESTKVAKNNENSKVSTNFKPNPNLISNSKSHPETNPTLIPLSKSNSDSKLVQSALPIKPPQNPSYSILKSEIETEAIVSHLKQKLEASANDSLFSELQRTFRLLHFAPHFQAFFHPLLTAMKALISKNEAFAHESRRFLLNYWPRLDPQKAVLFLQEATALCKEGPEIEEFVWQRLSWRASSIQWQIAMEGLNFISQTYQRAAHFDNSVLIYLLKDTIQHHWNQNVKNKATDVLKLVDEDEARAPKIFPINTWNLLKAQAESNYPNTDFTGRRRRKK